MVRAYGSDDVQHVHDTASGLRIRRRAARPRHRVRCCGGPHRQAHLAAARPGRLGHRDRDVATGRRYRPLVLAPQHTGPQAPATAPHPPRGIDPAIDDVERALRDGRVDHRGRLRAARHVDRPPPGRAGGPRRHHNQRHHQHLSPAGALAGVATAVLLLSVVAVVVVVLLGLWVAARVTGAAARMIP